MNEILAKTGSFYENLGNAIDYSFKFTNEDSFRIFGIDKNDAETQVGHEMDQSMTPEMQEQMTREHMEKTE